MKSEVKFLRLPQVKEMTCKSRSAIYREMAAGTFPRQIPIGSNQVVWVKAHVEDWIESKIAAAL